MPEPAEGEEAEEAVTDTQTIDMNGDERFVFPVVKIDQKGEGTITIRNNTDGGEMVINPPFVRDNTITIDCEKLTITNLAGIPIPLYEVGITDPMSIYWFRLAKGENNIEVTGNCVVTVEWREPRKVGAY